MWCCILEVDRTGNPLCIAHNIGLNVKKRKTPYKSVMLMGDMGGTQRLLILLCTLDSYCSLISNC